MRVAMRVRAPAVALAAAATFGVTGTARAQAAAAPAMAGVSSITEEDYRERIGLLAHDSMRGRDTPSPELEETAQYVARQFRAARLEPGAGDGYLQRFPLTRVRAGPAAAQRAVLRGPPGEVTLRPGEEFVPNRGTGVAEGSGTLVSVNSPGDLAGTEGKVVLARVDRSGLSAAFGGLSEALRQHRPAGLLIALDVEPEFFAQVRAFLSSDGVLLGEPSREAYPPVILVRADALPEGLRGGSVPDASGWSAELRTESEVSEAEGVNTIGVLEGSDPELAGEYVVFTAHMDHVGVGSPDATGDSVYNGADDDASGTATVLELAQAFAGLTERPRRSLLFMTVSGEEKGLLGSRWFSENPTVPLGKIVANINIDMVGRNWKDTIVAIGKEESTLGPLAERVAADHPELGLTVVDDLWPQERFYFRSDHYNFARKGVPILFFFSGTHEDYHRPSDEPAKIDYEKLTRVGRLLYHLGLEVANADRRPEWDPEAYRRVVESAP